MMEREQLINKGIYPTKYMADKVRKTSPWHSTSERIVKVCGGYMLMDERTYYVWKNQR